MLIFYTDYPIYNISNRISNRVVLSNNRGAGPGPLKPRTESRLLRDDNDREDSRKITGGELKRAGS